MLMDLQARRPIIFVASGLGGLVCVNTLRLAEADQDLADSIHGFVFYGTPFEGNAKAKWAEVARRVPALENLKKPSNLQDRSHVLIEINKAFTDLVTERKDPIRIECFYDETYIATAPLSIIDPKVILDNDFQGVADLLIGWVEELCSQSARDKDSVRDLYHLH
jgi:hypothetical protein